MTQKVSVILPVFNCGPYIAQALESILHQTHKNLEVLVCDDASTDATWEILKSFTDLRIKLFRNESNQGVIGTKNMLFAVAKGEYLLMQDGDDWSESTRIEILLEEFIKDPHLCACASNCYRITNKNTITLFKQSNDKYITLKECYDLPFMPATLMINKSVIKSVGGLNDYFSGLLAEDLYWVMLIAERHKIKYLSTSLYYYRFNEASITNTFNKKEKLVITDLVKELISQRIETGSDWVSNNNLSAIENFIDSKFSNSKWLSEKYRTMAAVQRDGKKRRIAIKLILKALKLNPFGVSNYVTLRYVLS
jgi:glycosyltransferase involved in cell wall biosynthesis